MMRSAPFLDSSLFARHGLVALFSLRRGGVSPPPFDTLNLGERLGDAAANVRRNLERLRAAGDLPDRPHTARQVHGTDVLACAGAGRDHDRHADILLVTEPGRCAGVRTADCLPLLLADPEAGLAAAVHAGWRGTAAGAAAAAVDALVRRGARSARLLAALGPHIGPCCFEIGEEAAGALDAADPERGAGLQRREGSVRADLAAINRRHLLHAGVRAERIERVGGCTFCRRHDFFSHRRDGGRTGRMLSVVALPRRP